MSAFVWVPDPFPEEPEADLSRLFEVAAMLGVSFDVEALEVACLRMVRERRWPEPQPCRRARRWEGQ